MGAVYVNSTPLRNEGSPDPEELQSRTVTSRLRLLDPNLARRQGCFSRTARLWAATSPSRNPTTHRSRCRRKYKNNLRRRPAYDGPDGRTSAGRIVEVIAGGKSVSLPP